MLYNFSEFGSAITSYTIWYIFYCITAISTTFFTKPPRKGELVAFCVSDGRDLVQHGFCTRIGWELDSFEDPLP